MTLVEALEAVGVTIETKGPVTVSRSLWYGSLTEHLTPVERETIIARFEGRMFLIVPLQVYEKGDVLEEWVVSAGAPTNVPRTILGLRDGRWVFLGRDRDTNSETWPTYELAEKFVSGV